jgi:hypothetical protein
MLLLMLMLVLLVREHGRHGLVDTGGRLLIRKASSTRVRTERTSGCVTDTGQWYHLHHLVGLHERHVVLRACVLLLLLLLLLHHRMLLLLLMMLLLHHRVLLLHGRMLLLHLIVRLRRL